MHPEVQLQRDESFDGSFVCSGLQLFEVQLGEGEGRMFLVAALIACHFMHCSANSARSPVTDKCKSGSRSQ